VASSSIVPRHTSGVFVCQNQAEREAQSSVNWLAAPFGYGFNGVRTNVGQVVPTEIGMVKGQSLEVLINHQLTRLFCFVFCFNSETANAKSLQTWTEIVYKLEPKLSTKHRPQTTHRQKSEWSKAEIVYKHKPTLSTNINRNCLQTQTEMSTNINRNVYKHKPTELNANERKNRNLFNEYLHCKSLTVWSVVSVGPFHEVCLCSFVPYNLCVYIDPSTNYTTHHTKPLLETKKKKKELSSLVTGLSTSCECFLSLSWVFSWWKKKEKPPDWNTLHSNFLSIFDYSDFCLFGFASRIDTDLSSKTRTFFLCFVVSLKLQPTTESGPILPVQWHAREKAKGTTKTTPPKRDEVCFPLFKSRQWIIRDTKASKIPPRHRLQLPQLTDTQYMSVNKKWEERLVSIKQREGKRWEIIKV